MSEETSCSVAVFAHNVAGVIAACIDSVLQAAVDIDLHCTVYVLANGCTDSTHEVVREIQGMDERVQLVMIPLADKANAWNLYVHELAPESALHCFVDGDVQVVPGAVSLLAGCLAANPEVNAVGAVPFAGRDRIEWTRRMVSYGRVSGGLYALRGSFLGKLQDQKTRIPRGFVGEDFLISAVAKNMPGLHGIYSSDPQLQIESRAGFTFRKLSLLRFADYLSYLRRLVRYRVRGYQLTMLMRELGTQGFSAMPVSVEEMYKQAASHPCYYWRGRHTLIDWLAVYQIRSKAASS